MRLLLLYGDYVETCIPPHEKEYDGRSEFINESKSARKVGSGSKDGILGAEIVCERTALQCLRSIPGEPSFLCSTSLYGPLILTGHVLL